MEHFVPSITPAHRGILIDGYALILFQDEVLLGSDAKRGVNIPIRGALIRSVHCKITWSEPSGYVIEKADEKAEVRVNGSQIERVVLCDGDSIVLGKSIYPQATFRFRIPSRIGKSAVLELPVAGASLDLLQVPAISSSCIRHVLLFRDFGTIGHDRDSHIYIPDFPCCTIRLWWIESQLIIEAARGVLRNNQSDVDKTVLNSPSSFHLKGLPCIHQFRFLTTRFRQDCDLRILDSY